jgi:hypothetical protein
VAALVDAASEDCRSVCDLLTWGSQKAFEQPGIAWPRFEEDRARDSTGGIAQSKCDDDNVIRETTSYAFTRRRFAEAPLERASVSSIAFVTNSITDVSVLTQCSFSARCSAFGIRVASSTHTTASPLGIPRPSLSLPRQSS